LQIKEAKGTEYLTCVGLESVIAESRRITKEDGKQIELALRELCCELEALPERVKVTVGPFIYWKNFDDNLRKTCNEIWKNIAEDTRG